MRKRLLCVVFCLIFLVSGCVSFKYSDNILFSINYGASSYGTIADCTDAKITIYTDGIVKVTMITEDEEEVANFQLSDEDLETLKSQYPPEYLRDIIYVQQNKILDGNKYWIWLYDTEDSVCCYIGGYMPAGNFMKNWDSIHEVLDKYEEIENGVEEYKSNM